MRRDELEITDRGRIDAILQRALVCRLGLAAGEEPYVVPLAFGYDGEALYFHSAKGGRGRKLEMIRANPRVCFEVDMDHELVLGDGPCACSIRYNSVIGFGTATILDGRKEKEKGLRVLSAHYRGEAGEFSDRMIDKIEVIRVDIESLTGKTRYA